MDKLLHLLSKNSQFTDAELASMLGEPVDYIRAQIKEYESKGIIKGYQAVVDWENVETDYVEALIELKVTPKKETGFDEMAKICMAFDEVEAVYLMAGVYDFALIVRGETMQDIGMFVAKKLSTIESVVSTGTHFIMPKYLNSSIQSIHPSGIRKFFDIANEMEDVISLSIGEPDFQTPWHIRDEGIRSLEKGRTWYSPNRGFADLLKEITKYYKRRFGITYEPQTQTLVTVGGSEAIDLAFRTLVERGDEVIIPQPAFVCYEPLTVMAGGVPVIINTKNEDNFRLRADDLRAAITDKTKMLVLPFPNNPTGAIMERHDLEEIARSIPS